MAHILILVWEPASCGNNHYRSDLTAHGGGTPPSKPYTVSGQVHVKGAPSDGIEDVTITFGGAANPVTTNADGLWSQDGLVGTVTVTPEHDDFHFEPEKQVVTKATTNVNFEGEPGYTASGTIADDDDDPIEGVVVEFSDGDASVTTGADGKWRRTGLRGVVTVTPSDPAYEFTSVTVSEADPTHDFQGEMKQCNEGSVTDETDPCVVTRVKQLQGMTLTGHYALGADINASASKSWNTGTGFEPIGAGGFAADMFNGSFDGRGHFITGLFINRPGTNNVGFFGGTYTGATIENVTLVDVDITGGSNTGGLIGSNSGGSVNNASSSGTVIGASSVGGLIGRNSGVVSGSYSAGIVSSSGDTIGGLVGYNNGANAKIEASHSEVLVEGNSRVGGLVGLNSGTIEDSDSVGPVTGSSNVGGLVGQSNGSIATSYSTSTVSGGVRVGGLVGYSDGGAIETSYSTGAVNGNERVGGLVGTLGSGLEKSYSAGLVVANDPTASDVGGAIGSLNAGNAIESVFWDLETSGQLTSAGGADVQGKSTEDMKKQATFEAGNWDFAAGIGVWQIDEGTKYPDLQQNSRH